MSIFSTSYSDSDIAQIQQLLENAEKVPVTWNENSAVFGFNLKIGKRS